MNAVETDGDNMSTPKSSRSASTVAGCNSTSVECDRHIEGTQFTLGCLLRTDYRGAQMETCQMSKE